MRVPGDPVHGDPVAEAFNDEVARLLREGLPCPVCNADPVAVEPIEPGEAIHVRCRAGHTYVATVEED